MEYLETGLRNYKVYGRQFKAHTLDCADGFKADRRHGLIYNSYREDDGSIIGVEEASRGWGFCAYCGLPRADLA